MFMLILNVIFMVLFWVWAIESFQIEDNNLRGWTYLFISAFSGAAILSSLF
jgi:uncharacterized membrane protein